MHTTTMPAPSPVIRLRLPRLYPKGRPVNWNDAAKIFSPALADRLRDAIAAYLNYRAHVSPPPGPEQISILADYCDYHIEAPCWRETTESPMQLAALRGRAKVLTDIRQIDTWIASAADLGLDPL